VNATNETVQASSADRALHATLAVQRAAFLRDGPQTLKQRRADLKLKEAILARQHAFVAALDADFGHRARQGRVSAGAVQPHRSFPPALRQDLRLPAQLYAALKYDR
jgi:hypothetical protein